MKALLFSTAAAAAIVLVAPAVAQNAPAADPAKEMHHMRMAMQPMTRAQVMQMVQTHFARLDTNKDGFLTREEMQSARQSKRSMVRTRVEQPMADHAGRMPDRGAMFDRLDSNHDGYVSRQEFTSAKPGVKKRVVIRNRGEHRQQGSMVMNGDHGAMAPMDHVKMIRLGGHMFEQADVNRDGRVSLQEATNAAAAHFDAADANHDQTLSTDEMRAAHQAMRAIAKR